MTASDPAAMLDEIKRRMGAIPSSAYWDKPEGSMSDTTNNDTIVGTTASDSHGVMGFGSALEVMKCGGSVRRPEWPDGVGVEIENGNAFRFIKRENGHEWPAKDSMHPSVADILATDWEIV